MEPAGRRSTAERRYKKSLPIGRLICVCSRNRVMRKEEDTLENVETGEVCTRSTDPTRTEHWTRSDRLLPHSPCTMYTVHCTTVINSLYLNE